MNFVFLVPSAGADYKLKLEWEPIHQWIARIASKFSVNIHPKQTQSIQTVQIPID